MSSWETPSISFYSPYSSSYPLSTSSSSKLKFFTTSSSSISISPPFSIFLPSVQPLVSFIKFLCYWSFKIFFILWFSLFLLDKGKTRMEKENQITEIWFSFSILVFPLSNFISFSSTFLNPQSFHYSVVELLQVTSLSPFDTKVTKNCKYLLDPHTSMVESKFEFCLWTYLLKLVKKKRRRKRTAAEIIAIVLAAYEKLTSNLSICHLSGVALTVVWKPWR